MTEQARQAQREYMRRWRAANKDKIESARERYWERKAREATADRENSLHNNHIERGVGDG